jgi:3-oxoacyl-[acyl-carrier protein] reductase
MDLGIKGKRAIVNGGSAGLGRGAALALAREGCEVYISARSEDRLQAAAADMARETGSSVIAVTADHSTEDGREKILAACPNPDILIGTCSPPPMSSDFREVSAQDWQEHLAVGLISPVEFMKAVVDGMAERGFGRIVNITTGAAKYPAEVRVLSGPPRAALSNYTTAIAKSLAKHNVIINNLLPGMHHTAATEKSFGDRAAEQCISYDELVQEWIDYWRIGANRFGDAEDFGALCAMLCSSQAGFMVGQDIVVDGGMAGSTF